MLPRGGHGGGGRCHVREEANGSLLRVGSEPECVGRFVDVCITMIDRGFWLACAHVFCCSLPIHVTAFRQPLTEKRDPKALYLLIVGKLHRVRISLFAALYETFIHVYHDSIIAPPPLRIIHMVASDLSLQEGEIDDEARSRLKEFLLEGDEAAQGILDAYMISQDEVSTRSASRLFDRSLSASLTASIRLT